MDYSPPFVLEALPFDISQEIGEMSFDDLFPVIDNEKKEDDVPETQAKKTRDSFKNFERKIGKKKGSGRPRKSSVCVFCRIRHVACSEDCLTYKLYGSLDKEQVDNVLDVWELYGSRIFYREGETMRSSRRITDSKELLLRIDELKRRHRKNLTTN